MPRKIAICIGQNTYDPASGVTPLRGCINDALLVGAMLRHAGFDIVRQVHDAGATQKGILDRLAAEIARLREGDCFVFWNSSHGYQMRDRSGDELLDGLDEAICSYDTDPRDPLTDDKFGRILARAHPKAKVFFASDSCHSGSLTRDAVVKLRKNSKATYRAPRLWMPPEDVFFRTGRNELSLEDYVKGVSAPESVPATVRRFGRFSQAEADLGHVFLSGCKSDQVSWDASFNGRAHGAMTFNFAVAVLKAWKAGKTITYREAHKEAIKGLKKGGYKQDPQLEGPDKLKDQPVFFYKP